MSELSGRRGVILPAEALRLTTTGDRMLAVYAAAGYERVVVPVMEPAGLFRWGAAGGALADTYVLEDHAGQRWAVRPELTACLLAAYLRLEEPGPVRWAAMGPVVRHTPDGPLELWQHGVEFLGQSAPEADAEVLLLAVRAARAAGIEDPVVRLGHVGGVRGLLRRLGLGSRVEWVLLEAMQDLAEGTVTTAGIRERLQQAGLLHGSRESDELAATLAQLPEEDATEFVRRLLETMRTPAGTSRPADAVLRRLLRKVRHGDELAGLDQALGFLAAWVRIQGPPARALEEARAVAAQYRLDPDPVPELSYLAKVLERDGAVQVQLDLGMTRAIGYYSGMVFSVHATAGGPSLGGGGRYDGLAADLGRRPVPAAGFAFDLEAVATAGGAS